MLVICWWQLRFPFLQCSWPSPRSSLVLEMAGMLEVLPLEVLSFCGCSLPYVLGSRGHEELQPALSPAPVHLSWIIDKAHSFLGEVSFFTILMISCSLAVDSPCLPCVQSSWPLPITPLHGTYQSHATHWLTICHFSWHNFPSIVTEVCTEILESKKEEKIMFDLGRPGQILQRS